MAIFDLLEVRIFANGQPLHEYERPANNPATDNTDNKDDGPLVERYVESQPGANFMVEVKASAGFQFTDFDGINFAIRVDGQLAHQPLITKEDYEAALAYVRQSEGPKVFSKGQWHVRKYRFSALRLREESKAVQPTLSNYIGSIRVVVHYVRRTPTATPGVHQVCLSEREVSEKQLKGRATDTVTTLDAAVKTDPARVWISEMVSDTPVVTFNFRYYTREGLRSIGIIEEPQPSDPFDLLDPESLSKEDSLRLLDIANAGPQNSRKKIKEEDQTSGSPSSSNKRVRTQYDPDELEEIPAPTQSPRQQSTGSIDLG